MDSSPKSLQEALAAGGDLQAICDTTADYLVATGFPLPSIYLKRGQRLRYYVSRGYWQIVDGFPPTAGVLGRVYRESQPVFIPDTAADPEFIAAIPGIRGQAALPISCEDETIGVLNVETTAVLPHDCLSSLSEVARELGNHIAAQGGLPPETRAEQAFDAVVEISGLTTADAIGRATVAAVVRLSGLESALLLVGPPEAYERRASTGPSYLAEQLRFEDLDILTQLVRSGTSSYVAGGGELSQSHQFLLDAGVGSLIVLPLRGQGRLDGLLLISDRSSITPASSQVRLLEQVTLQAATSLRTVEALDVVHEQVGLLEVVNGVFAHFVSLPTQDFSQGIDVALKEIGTFAQVDRSYLFVFRDDGTTMDNTNEWCATGVESLIERLQGIPASHYGHLWTVLLNGDAVHIPSVPDMPPDESGVRQRLVDGGICSLVAVPLHENGRLVGVLGFDAVRTERKWSHSALQLLRSIASVLVNARQRKQAVDALEHQALHDTLTGLPNRSLFFDRLDTALARVQRRAEDRVAVIFCDVDAFKHVNDRMGHQVGDRLLQTVADRIRLVVRTGDTLARLSGDEFTLVCEGVRDIQEIISISHRIVAEIAKPLTLGAEQFHLTISVGVAVSEGNDVASALLARADDAMYTAKRRGRNQVVVSSSQSGTNPAR